MSRRTNTAVWLDKYDRWQIKVQKDGERRTFTCSAPGRTGQRECNRKADEWLESEVFDSKTRVETVVPRFIENMRARGVSSEWCDSEERRCKNWIVPYIGKKKVSSLKESDLQDIIYRAARSTISDPTRGMSKKSLKSLRATMMSLLKYCRRRHMTSLYPETLEIPKNAPTKEKKILQPSDLAKLFLSSKTTRFGKVIDDPYIHAYRYAVLTGLRPGELIGLEWPDIDGDIVRLKRSVTVLGNVTAGKNENAKRYFVMSKMAKQELEQQRPNPETSRVFGIEHEDTYRHFWRRYCAYNDIPYITPYEMRHTFVSMMQSLPEGELKALVGHSKNMDTWGVYGHDVARFKKQTAQKIEAIFTELLNPDPNNSA